MDATLILSQIAALIPQPFFWLDREQRCLGANKRCLTAVGLPPSENVMGKTPLDYYPETMARIIMDHHREVIRTGKTLRVEEAIQDVKTGQYKVFDTTISPLRDAHGHIIGTCGTSIDITREQAFTQTEKNQMGVLQQFANTLPVPFYWLDKEQYYLGVNSAFFAAAGVHSFERDIAGKTPKDIYPQAMAQNIIDHHREALHTGKTLQAEEAILDVTTGQYKVFDATISPLRDSYGKIIGTCGISIDITYKKALTQKLKNDAYMPQQFADLLPEPFYWLDLEQHYLGVNLRGFQVTGTTSFEEDFAGKTPKALYPKKMAETIIAHHQEVIRRKKVLCFEEAIQDISTKGYKVFRATIAPLRDHKDHIIGTCGISVDITRERELNAHLIQAKEQAEAAEVAKSELAANVSHDMRTPITGILGMNYKTLDDLDEAETDLGPLMSDMPQLQTLFDTVRANQKLAIAATDELLTLCNHTIELLRLQTGNLSAKHEVFDLQTLLSHTVTLLEPAASLKDLDLSFHIATDVPDYVQGIRLYLERILRNLVGNAVKFTKQGTVKVTARLTAPQKVQPPFAAGSTLWLTIGVEDTGIGIPSDKLTVIFEHFTRLSPAYKGIYKGAGLGLHATKRYVEAMGGRIFVDSQVDKGSTFRVRVPMVMPDNSTRGARAPCLPADSQGASFGQAPTLKKVVIDKEIPMHESYRSPDVGQKKPAAPLPPLHILIVEDNATAETGLLRALKHFTCTTDIAKDGIQALKMAQKEDYDLILMDVGLPDIDGTEVTQKMRELGIQTPIFAVTGHADDQQGRQACFDAGMQAILTKPAKVGELQSVLRTYFLPQKQKDPQTLKSRISESTPTDALPVIDWEGSLQLCEGDRALLHKMLTTLADDLEDSLPALAQGYANRDMHLLRKGLHCLRGGICYLKIPELDHCLKQLHHIALSHQAGDDVKLRAGYGALQQAILRFRDVYRQTIPSDTE